MSEPVNLDQMRWEYHIHEGDWSVRGRYLEPNNVEVLYKGHVFKTVTVASYKIWNMAHHFPESIPFLEEELKQRESEASGDRYGILSGSITDCEREES